jgi:glycosyltransferase involved in cell wall biosynthesis/SAM-dependent methyltransferase
MNICNCNYCNSVLLLPTEVQFPTSLQSKLKISGRTKNDCQTCGSTVLDRQLKFYFDEVKFLNGRSSIRILDFNPESRFISYLANLKPELHILAMNDAIDRRYESVNIEEICYSDNSFDLIIANYQLETVASIEKTLNELNRVLKPEGLLILQSSFSHVLESTWEDTGLNSKELREAAYGNGLHRRLFGKDIVEIFSNYLNSNVLHFHQMSQLRHAYALDAEDPFMLFRKKIHIKTLPKLSNIFAKDKKPMVSILCITYNHESFISKTLESLIIQQTNFSFEIVIGEDCSTDDTLKILKNWAVKYPDIIKLLSGEPNLGVQSNWVRTYEACTGRYVAICEGDDRWTDPLKLQKQFDYMEANPNCALTFGNAQAHKDKLIEYNYIGGAKIDLSPELLQYAPPINTLTVMFRNILGKMPPEIYATGALDMFIWSLLGHHGYGHYMPEILPSIYNQHAGGIHSLTGTVNQHRLRMRTFFAAYHYYIRIGQPGLANYFSENLVKDAEYISKNTSPQQVIAFVIETASEIANAIKESAPLFPTALNTIIDQVNMKLGVKNVN